MTYDRLILLTDRQIDDLARLDDDNRLVPYPEPEAPADAAPAMPKTPQERLWDLQAACLMFRLPVEKARAEFTRYYGKSPEEMGCSLT